MFGFVERQYLELFIGLNECYHQNMLSFDEFLKLISDADEDTISSVEQTLGEVQRQTELQE